MDSAASLASEHLSIQKSQTEMGLVVQEVVILGFENLHDYQDIFLMR